MTTRPTWEGAHRDRYWAAAISATLHAMVAVWALTVASGAPGVRAAQGTSSHSLALHMLGEDEFRQRIEVASPLLMSIPLTVEEPETAIVQPQVQAAAEATGIEAAQSEHALPSTSMPSIAASAVSTAGLAGSAAPQVDAPENPSPYDAREQAYMAALRAAIQSKWTQQYGHCSVTIQQTVGGHVVGAVSKSCALSGSDRQALEAAVLAAQPLPYAGFERVFREQITVEMGN